ncbi:MAG TPA: hypothetical protein VH352_16005 [Pseudonocardiaceae bacterium]|jgi:hypothetical protein|nr:hypothetical protein [Pseudonocardiaceae bacterium]
MHTTVLVWVLAVVAIGLGAASLIATRHAPHVVPVDTVCGRATPDAGGCQHHGIRVPAATPR